MLRDSCESMRPSIPGVALSFTVAAYMLRIYLTSRPNLLANSVGIVLPALSPFLHLKAFMTPSWLEVKLTEWAVARFLTPTHAFGAPGTIPPAPDYTHDDTWVALWPRRDTADLQSDGYYADEATANFQDRCDLFYLHPTTFYSASSWNAPFNDTDAALLVDEGIVYQQASAFHNICRIYAPRFRQMTASGYFERVNGAPALDLAYSDVRAAFIEFLKRRDGDSSPQGSRPLMLAAHSQGTTLMERLLLEFFAPVSSQLRHLLVVAFLLGMEVHDGPYSWSGKSTDARKQDEDLAVQQGRTLLPLCEQASQTGCVVAFRTFLGSEDVCKFLSRPLVEGTRTSTPLQKKVCTNPITWTAMGATDNVSTAGQHLGCMPIVHPWVNMRYLIFGHAKGEASVDRLNGSISDIDKQCSLEASCTEDGALLIKMSMLQKLWASGFAVPFPAWTVFSFPGQNTHAYDFNFFFNNLRQNGATRLKAWARASLVQ